METKNAKTEEVKTASPYSSVPPCQQLFNAFIVNCWIGPLVLMYWSSTWNLLGSDIIFPDDIYLSVWVSAGIGFGIYFLASCTQKQLYSLSRPKDTSLGSVVVAILLSRVYTYVMAFASVNQWRAVWHGWDVYTSYSEYNALGTALGAYFIMILLRCSAQVLGPPSVAALDVPLRTYYETSTYFRTKVSTWQHVLDALFTATVVPFLVVTAWRGVWYLQDKWIVPEDLVTSALYSLVIAYGLEGLLLLTRGAWRKLSFWSDSKHWLVKYLIEDTHLFLHNIVAISHWRGFWILYEQDFLDYHLKFWLFHAISYLLLTVTVSSNSIVPRGCLRDGMQSRGEGIELDMYYITNLLKLWEESLPKSKQVEEEDPRKSWTSLEVVQMEEMS